VLEGERGITCTDKETQGTRGIKVRKLLLGEKRDIVEESLDGGGKGHAR